MEKKKIFLSIMDSYAQDEIREAFADTNVEIINIGDSVRARRIIDGVQEGHNILNVLADHEYL